MVKESYRLVRMLDAELDGENFDYLASCEDSRYQFSRSRQDAMLFDTWEDFVTAAEALWRSSGPVDIMFERVYSLS